MRPYFKTVGESGIPTIPEDTGRLNFLTLSAQDLFAHGSLSGPMLWNQRALVKVSLLSVRFPGLTRR